MDQSNQTDWITIAQAAKEFARTRQAIESLVKKGCIGHKRMGNKANIHISRGELQLHYANLATPKLATKSSPVEGAKFANQTHSVTLQIQLIIVDPRFRTSLYVKVGSRRRGGRDRDSEAA
jgi:hypothetical protein